MRRVTFFFPRVFILNTLVFRIDCQLSPCSVFPIDVREREGKCGVPDFLLSELTRRQKNNPRYSLRAFARQLGFSPAHLSNLMSGRRKVTPKTLKTLVRQLAVEPSKKSQFFDQVLDLPSRSTETENQSRRLLQEDEFQLIAEWHHLAILSLGNVRNNSRDPVWIARRLGLEIPKVREAWRRLERLDLIENNGNGFRQKGKSLRTQTDVPSQAIRVHHRDLLQLAQQKLDEVSVEDRDFRAISFAFSKSEMPEAKKLLEEFHYRFANELEGGDAKNEVYNLSLAFFPMTRLEKEREKK
jgi:uncharacterized protein (TIGR02147 family)